MKLECKVEEIKNAVSQAERITGKNLTLPILSSILITTNKNSITLRSTNLSIGIEIEVSARIERPGTVAIPGNVLNSVFSSFSHSENITLDGDGGNLVIKSKKSKIKIKGSSPEDFPTIPKVTGTNFQIDSKKVIEGIKSVYYSALISDIKPEISSVYIYTDGENLTFVSTDSFRLAEKKIKTREAPEITGILIPFKNVSEIVRVFGDYKGNLNVCFNKNSISISGDKVYLTSRVIDGIFPDYRQIIPKGASTTVVVLKQDLLNALKISNIFSDKFNQVNLLVDPKGKKFELSSANNDVGENKTLVDGAITGEEVELGFNYKYFLDCFQAINTDSLSIKLSGPMKPIVVNPVGDSSFTYLIMPMNK